MLRLGIHAIEKYLSQPLIDKSRNNIAKAGSFILSSNQTTRYVSFLNKVDAEQLWKGVTCVSNAGKKRGRGKGGDKRIRKNLNVGQKIGAGKNPVIWPGLNHPIIKKNTMIGIHKLPSDKVEPPAEGAQENIIKKERVKIHPLERGWTARSIKGKKIGPPDPVGEVTFENFESVVIEHKLSLLMTSIFGKKRLFYATVLTGNKNGLIGMGKAKGLESKSSIEKAKNRAAKKLIAINLEDPTSVNHDFYSRFGNTRLFVKKKPEGFGLRCQRVVKVCCELLGIKNIHVKIEGSVNYKNVVKAFIIGLLTQKSYQQIADEKKLHLVELRKERFNYPEVLASPQKCLTEEETKSEITEFTEYIMGGVVLEKPKPVPFYERLPNFMRYLKRTQYKRNHDKVKLKLMAEYGEFRSYLTDIYPECREPGLSGRMMKKTEAA